MLIDEKIKAPEYKKGSWAVIEKSPVYAIDAWQLGTPRARCLTAVVARHSSIDFDNDSMLDLPRVQWRALSSGRSTEAGQHPQGAIAVLQGDADLGAEATPATERVPHVCLLQEPLRRDRSLSRELCAQGEPREGLVLQVRSRREWPGDSFVRSIDRSSTADAIACRKLDGQQDTFPVEFCKYKILPALVAALDFGAANSRALAPLLKIGTMLNEEEYATLVTPSVVKWFATPDRALRVNLLQNLPTFAHHLNATLVNNEIYPNVANGFSDPNPTLRELTVKSMIYLAPKAIRLSIWLASLPAKCRRSLAE